MEPTDAIQRVTAAIQRQFSEEHRILSFDDWLSHFLDQPYRLGRSAPQYVVDMFDHYGAERVETAAGRVRRHKLFDQTFRDGEGKVHGQEAAQQDIHRLLRTAADGGRTEKLILLHGPNGSGKSVLVEAVFRGLEHYSKLPEGTLYRFNWVFPKSSEASGSLGFGPSSTGETLPGDSLALLAGDELASRLVCELKDHPLFLIPREEREDILEAALERHPDDRRHSFCWVLEGDLCRKCKGIYEGLLAGYRGDWRKVVRHAQIERLYISQRFRVGAVTIHPMGSVDALEQQITADISAQNLPPVLHNLKIFEPFGDLVDANSGVVEYGDFLKRPMDLNKYLLNAVEKGTISLANSLIYLNVVMVGTSNEKHLDAFKATPEFTSFKGRIELVPVPYLLEYRREASLYSDMIRGIPKEVHVAPHALETAALWAILTRLRPPDPSGFEGRLAELVKDLAPFEKAVLYDRREAPDRLGRADRAVLLAGVPEIRAQNRDTPIYEGRFGASPREMRMVLSNAAYDRKEACLTPDLVFKNIRDLIKDKSVYDFLKLKAVGGYHEAEAFVDLVSDHHAGVVLGEIQDAMDLIREEEYDRRFDEYLLHVIAFNRGEKMKNPQSGAIEPPSETIMRAVEDLLDTGGSRDTFRKDLVARIGAFALDHPDDELSFRNLFPDLLRAVKKDFFEKQGDAVRALLDNILRYEKDDPSTMAPADLILVETTLANLVESRGYCPRCARSATAYLRSHSPPQLPE